MADALREIIIVYAVIGSLQALRSLVDLNNMYSTGLITIDEYLIRIVLQFLIVPAMPAVVIGIIIHLILEALNRT
jgi:hypothetical protein